MPTLKTLTLGCKVNQYETEYVRGALQRLGYADASENGRADLVLLNTCTVTAQSDLKTRKAIRKMAKENPGAEILVMGCFAKSRLEEAAKFPEVAHWFSDNETLERFLADRGLAVLPRGITAFAERHRAFVKAQDGCTVGCSYCIIPKVRPRLQSRPPEHLLEEIQTLSENGYREIVLTGIHLGHYGVDSVPKSNLAELVRRILDHIERRSLPIRLRISSLEAVEVSEELIELIRAFPQRICPHLHLSMQSGSDEILRKMKRRWLSGPFIEKCRYIQSRLDQVALSTDVIVGFPGETDRHFRETCEVVEQLGFSKTHIFRFSPRTGTEAATLPDRVPPAVQKERAAELAAIAQRLREQYAGSLLGKTVQVLFETEERTENAKSVLSGTSDRYLKTTAAVPPTMLGQLADVRITKVQGEELFGELVSM